MKIKFSNLGSIKETELDLRPLTVIIGPNNSNKTYIAYCVYGILQQFLSAIDEGNTNTIDAIRPAFDNSILDSLVTKERNKWFLKLDSNAKTLFVETLQKIFNENLSHFKEKINVFFQNHSQPLFANTNFAVSPLDFDTLIQNVLDLDLDKDVKQFGGLEIKHRNEEQTKDFFRYVLCQTSIVIKPHFTAC
jgi:AAA15 family ATPase/GTPase